MPSVNGYISEEDEEKMEQLIENGKYEDVSEFTDKAVSYYLDQKYNMG